jgi:hypothetical protein
MVAATLAWRQKAKVDALRLYPDGPSTFALRGFSFFAPDTQNALAERACAQGHCRALAYV